MRKYESVIIFDSGLNEENLKKEISRFETLLNANGASDLAVNVWGKKQLAFEMRHQQTGTYVCYAYGSENSAICEVLTTQLRLSESVLRFQTHKLNDHPRKFQGRPGRTPVPLDDGADDLDAAY